MSRSQVFALAGLLLAMTTGATEVRPPNDATASTDQRKLQATEVKVSLSSVVYNN